MGLRLGDSGGVNGKAPGRDISGTLVSRKRVSTRDLSLGRVFVRTRVANGRFWSKGVLRLPSLRAFRRRCASSEDRPVEEPHDDLSRGSESWRKMSYSSDVPMTRFT